jgi:hypothetical protein
MPNGIGLCEARREMAKTWREEVDRNTQLRQESGRFVAENGDEERLFSAEIQQKIMAHRDRHRLEHDELERQLNLVFTPRPAFTQSVAVRDPRYVMRWSRAHS